MFVKTPDRGRRSRQVLGLVFIWYFLTISSQKYPCKLVRLYYGFAPAAIAGLRAARFERALALPSWPKPCTGRTFTCAPLKVVALSLLLYHGGCMGSFTQDTTRAFYSLERGTTYASSRTRPSRRSHKLKPYTHQYNKRVRSPAPQTHWLSRFTREGSSKVHQTGRPAPCRRCWRPTSAPQRMPAATYDICVILYSSRHAPPLLEALHGILLGRLLINHPHRERAKVLGHLRR